MLTTKSWSWYFLRGMKIISAELFDQAFNTGQLPHIALPQVAVMGRSNVGKSSLLAKMMRRKKLVKTSSTPGKTRGIFFYLVNGSVMLVDLPGYGFSKAPRAIASGWKDLVEAYLDRDSGPDLALQLIDIRHPPTGNDLAVNHILTQREIPFLVVATKADKISRSAGLRSISVIARDISVPSADVIPFSAKDSSFNPGKLWDSVIKRLEVR